MRIEESIDVYAPREKIWDIFTDLTCWKEWNTVLSNVSPGKAGILSEGQSFSCSIEPFKLLIFFEPEVQEIVPNERIVWTSTKYGISARHEFLFKDNGNAVRVTSRETFSGLAVVVSPFFFAKSKIRKLTRSLLEGIKEAAESSGQNRNGQN